MEHAKARYAEWVGASNSRLGQERHSVMKEKMIIAVSSRAGKRCYKCISDQRRIVFTEALWRRWRFYFMKWASLFFLSRQT
eukprot:scaffold75551_cov21-Tisochrysis_lutea.AAC.2